MGITKKIKTITTMKVKDFTTTIEVPNSPQEVFNAINNVRGWWQGVIKGNTEKLHDEFTYQMAEFHLSKQKIVELVPYKKVVWQVTESSINFVADKKEWLNTTICFEITADKNNTQLIFTHQGLVPEIECYGGCSGAWEQLIQQSLYSLITTGKGVEVF
jgi:Activator of Hsp90 ATPase homolog 1-like protein